MNNHCTPLFSIELRYIAVLLCAFAIYSCGTPRPFIQSGSDSKPDSLKAKKTDFEVFLIGDTGNPNLDGPDAVLETLNYQLSQAGDSSSIVFLGDNIYSDGMNPDTTIAAEREDEAIIDRTLEALSNFTGSAYFLPGNHDWRYGTRGVRAQERYIESRGRADAEFLPNNGCPGPEGVELGENWFMVTFDSDWLINHSYDSSVSVEGCEYKTRTAVMNRIAALVEEHGDRNVLIATHHPFFSNGSHGGFYPFRDHIFPLTNLNDKWYLPLPLIGSIYPIYRKLGRSGQDLNHQRYEYFTYELREKVEDTDNLFFAGGHEHSLGFYQKEKRDADKEGEDFFILSGAGSKQSYARTGYGAEFVYSHKGFAKLVSYEDGTVNVEFWTPADGSNKGTLVYHKELIAPEAQNTIEERISKRRKKFDQTKDTVKTVKAGPNYKAGSLYRAFWGDHYRDVWTTDVDMPIFDLDTKKGGLEVLAVTGGEQTVTIIVQDSSQNRYVMRSVQKNPAKSLPDVLQETFVKGITQDQISASHPFGMLIVPPLSAAAGVYGTNPEVGFISQKSGIEMDVGEKEGALVSFEEFVSKDWFNKQYDKNAVDIISSNELWERKRRGGNVKIDEEQLVRSRIFDMYLGDWDRHEGQWFWAETRNDSISIFEPIPIDRDNAFFKSDGAIPWLGRRKWALRKFQLFNDGIRDIAGINFNARFFDRWFINSLPREKWISIAADMQKSMTDSVIAEAVNQWPEPVQEISAETFARKLKQRRDKLTEFAGRYYDILTKEVNIYGSDTRDRFTVKRIEDEAKLQITVAELPAGDSTSNRELTVYNRTFKASETREIRLFGFGDDDEFIIYGESDESVTIRIVGGEGRDVINDRSKVDGRSNQTVLYDTKDGIEITSDGGEIEKKISDDPRVNRFRDRAFAYNTTTPLVSVGFTGENGIFLGGGVIIETQGFRKEPFAAKHRITAKTSLGTPSFAFNYQATHTNEVGPLDLKLGAEILAPQFVTNYFGLGNETETRNNDYDFFDYEINNVDLDIGVSEGLENLLFVNAGLGYEFLDPISTANTFITSPQGNLSNDDFGPHHFANINTGFRVNTVDDLLLPHYGVEFRASAELAVGLNKRSDTFMRFKTVGKAYYTIESITTTIAGRVGLATNVGDFDFFQANTLSGQRLFTGTANLRGFVRKRFSGRTSFYHNTELRTKLGNFDSILFPAQFGITAFVDEGRVWADGQTSDVWHVGYGGGVWISPLEFFVVNANYALSKEDEFITVTLGFNF